MIEYYKELFTKPRVLWSTLDTLAMVGLIALAMIIFAVCAVIILAIIEIHREKRFKTCANKSCMSMTNKNCAGCKKYKKRGKDNENIS